MNTGAVYAPMDPALKPTRRMLMQLVAVKSGGLLTARAERLQIRGMTRSWSTAVIEQLLTQLLARAEALEEGARSYNASRRNMDRKSRPVCTLLHAGRVVYHNGLQTYVRKSGGHCPICDLGATGPEAFSSAFLPPAASTHPLPASQEK